MIIEFTIDINFTVTNRNNFDWVSERNPYPTRRENDISLPPDFREQHRNSFMNLSIRDWNCLPDSLRSIELRSAFKRKLRPKPNPDPYYQHELNRKAAIDLTRLRCDNANLNHNLFGRNLSETAACSCGDSDETVTHFLIECPLYQRARRDAVNLLPAGSWNTRDLLHGSKVRYNAETNKLISMTVQAFIQSTGRFS